MEGGERRPRGKPLAGDLDLVTPGLDPFPRDARFADDVAHADGGADRVAEHAGREISDDLAVAADRLVVVEQRLRVLQGEQDEALADARIPLAQRGVAADEPGVLPVRHGEAEAGFLRRVLVADVVPPVAIALFQAEGVHRVEPDGGQPEVPTARHELVADAGGELGRHVELPAQLPDVGDAGRARRRVADVDLAGGREGEGVVAEIRARDPRQQVPGPRPHDAEDGVGGRHVRDRGPRPVGDVAAEPVDVPHLTLRPGHDEEAVLGEAGHGDVGLDAAAVVEPLRVDDAARGNRDVVGADAVERRLRVGAGHHDLAEAALVDQPDALAHRPMLVRRILEPVLAPPGILVPGLDPFRRVPVGTLPAGGLPEAGPARREPVVEGRPADAARRRELPEGPAHVVEEAQPLDDALLEIAGVPLERLHPARVDLPQVHARMAVDDPLGEHLAGAARRPDADRVEPAREVEVPKLGRLAEEVAVVRREALRSAEERLDARLREGGNAMQGAFHDGLEVVPVLGQLVELEVLGDAVHAPGFGLLLEGAHEQLARVLLDVEARVLLAQRRGVGAQPRDRLGHDVEVLGGVERRVDARQPADLAAPHAAAVDDELRADVAVVRRHARDPAAAPAYGRDPGVLEDPRAAHTRALGVGQRRVDGIRLPLARDEDPADQVVRVQQRPQVQRLSRRQHPDLEPEAAAHGGVALELDEPFLVGRHEQRPILLVAGGLAGLLLQGQQNLGGVLGEARHVERGAELPDQARGMPRRPAGQRLSFQQDDVGPARPGQVIGDAATDDAAADDDDPGLLR